MISYSLLAIPLPLQVILVLLIPVGTLVLGDLISRVLLKGVRTSLEERLLIDFITGTVFSISVLLFAGLAGILVPAEFALIAILAASCGYWSYRTLSQRHGSIHDFKRGKLGLATAIVYLGYLVRVGIEIATKPIQDADAMSLYIPAGKAFTTLSGIPVQDPFHFWNTWFEPGISMLYSWAFTLSGSTQSEAFRVVPLLPFVLLPIAVFVFVLETFKSRVAASIALILVVFMPATDFMLRFYLYYPDIFAVLLMLIALAFYQRIPSGKLWAESVVGMSLGLTLLFKYDIGLFATAVIVLMTVSRMFAKLTVTRAIRISGVVVLSAVFVFGGNALWNLLAGGYMVYVTLLVIIGALVVTTHRGSLDLGERTRVRSLLIILFFMMPSIVWGIRSLLVGNSVFGVYFLRLPSALSGGSASVQAHISGSPFSIPAILTPFLHPWYNALVFPIGVIAVLYTLRRQHSSGIVSLFLLYFLYYLTIIGFPPSGRHLLFDGILVVAMVAFLLAEYEPLRVSFLQYAVLIFCCATSILAWPTLYFYAISSPYYSLLHNIGLVVYRGAYYANGSLSIFLQHGLPLYAELGCVIGACYLLGPYVQKNANRNLRRLGTVAFISILLVGSFLQFVPYLELASASTNGNILNFSSTGSYYQPDLDVAISVSKIVPGNSTIITWNNPALDFTYPRVLDLARSGTYVLTPIQGMDEANISMFLIENGFDYLLLPSGAGNVGTSFHYYLMKTPLLLRILTDRWVIAVDNGVNGWTLFRVEAPT